MGDKTGWLKLKTHSVSEGLRLGRGQYVRLLGWVASRSVVGGVTFAVIRDGTGSIQVAGKRGSTREEVLEAMKSVSVESAVMVGGELREDARAPGGREVSVREFEFIVPSDKWPITKSTIKSSSFLYDMRHLSIRGRKASAIARVRAEVIYAAFEFFTSRGFMFISAPTIVQSACEGGATLFSLDYFGRPAYLTQSAQLYEEAAICALEKVFTVQPTFRAEKSKTAKHLTEFWMIEAEQAFADQEDNLSLQEGFVAHLAGRVADRRSNELRELGRGFEPPEPPFPRLTYDEVRDMAEKKQILFKWGEDIPTEAERLVSRSFDKPVFVKDYPLSARGFYHMTRSDNDKITLSSDLFAPEGYGEIATGGQRIHDYGVLMGRIKGQELPLESFRWYLELRRYGLPPHSGFGLGVERAVRWICGLKNIRAASLFPRTVTRITP